MAGLYYHEQIKSAGRFLCNNIKLEKFKNQVVSVIGAAFPREEARIMYRDNENDFVTLSTETDLKYPLRCADKAANDQELYRFCSTPRQDRPSINIVAVLDVETLKLAKEHFLLCLGLHLLSPLQKWMTNGTIVKAR